MMGSGSGSGGGGGGAGSLETMGETIAWSFWARGSKFVGIRFWLPYQSRISRASSVFMAARMPAAAPEFKNFPPLKILPFQ